LYGMRAGLADTAVGCGETMKFEKAVRRAFLKPNDHIHDRCIMHEK
jgi:hypothetical protein